MVLAAQPRAAAEVAPAVPVLPHHHVDAHPRQRHHLVERAVVAVGQQDVARLQPAVQAAEQGHLAGELPLAGADGRVEHTPGGQGDQDDDPGDREPAPRLLVAVLGVLGLVLGGVGHADGRAVGEDHAAAVEQPGLGGVVLEAVGGVADQPGQERLGEPLAGLAVAAGVGRAGGQPAGGAPGQEPGDGGEAGVVVAEELGEEEGEGDQGGEDPVAGLAHLLGDDAGDVLGVEDAGEDQGGVEDEGAEQGAELRVGTAGLGSDTVGPPCRSRVVKYPRFKARRAYLVQTLER